MEDEPASPATDAETPEYDRDEVMQESDAGDKPYPDIEDDDEADTPGKETGFEKRERTPLSEEDLERINKYKKFNISIRFRY